MAVISISDTLLVGLIDDEVTQFFGVPVHSRDELRPEGVADTPYERLVVMSLGEIDAIRTTLEAKKIPADRIVWL